MNRNIRPVCLLALLLAADGLQAQSLGNLAQQEEERRKAIASPAKVLTDKDLPPVTSPAPTPAPAAATAPQAGAPKGEVDHRIPVAAAQWRSGSLPVNPVEAISGGEVLLEVTVDQAGQVTGVKTLRHTPPFTEVLTAAVRSWVFRPAEDAATPKAGEPIDPKTRKPVESKVLVSGLFRPPALYSTTLGTPPKTVAAASDEIPWPTTAAKMPLYPPLAISDAVVLAELRIGLDGTLLNASVIQSTPGFDQPTLDALKGMAFRPAHVRGASVASFAYVVTGFRRPVTPGGSTTGTGGCTGPNCVTTKP